MNPIIKSFLTVHGLITYITLCNANGACVTVSSLGAGIISIVVPDSKGNMADVALGYDNAESYYNDGPTMGKIPGRYANRIGYGRFSIDSICINLPTNLPPHTLHGGFETGIHNKIWKIDNHTDNSVRFSLVSPDGDAGFPGELSICASYVWNDENELSLRIEAVSSKPTVVNFTSHAYLNLKGATSGSALDHILKINASNYLETDKTLLPTGIFTPVKDTPMDFTSPHAIGDRINEDYTPLKYAKGYDHCFVIDGYVPGKLSNIATLTEPTTGRIVEVLSDQPGAQLYTANWMNGAPVGKNGYKYKDYDGIAIEPQDFPDSPNHPEFPSTRLNPGEKYCRNIILKFKTKK